MITKDRVTEIFCIIDEFDKNLGGELKKSLCLFAHNSSRKCYINRKGRLSESEMITILICYYSYTAQYIALSWTYVLPLLPIAFLTIKQRCYLFILKNQSS